MRLPMKALNRYRIRDLLVHTAIVAIVLALFRIPRPMQTPLIH